MMFKVVIIISLLKACVGDVPSHAQHQSNQAISSQEFVRHDVPLSYKYSWVHVYTTAKPDEYRHVHVIPQNYLVRQQVPEIQYAPIQTDQTKQYAPNAVSIAPEKPHLEPRPENVPNIDERPEHLAYVPGYNVEVLQTVNRYPGHNPVFKSYPNMSPKDKMNKVNFLNQYVLYQNQEQYTTTQAPKQHEIISITTPTPGPARTKPIIEAFLPKQHSEYRQYPYQNAGQVPNVKTIPVPLQLVNLQDYLPHPKAHRMLLNIARTYNIAQASLKGQHGLMLKNMPSHTQAFIQIRNPTNVDKNTLLSVHNKNLYSPVHRSP